MNKNKTTIKLLFALGLFLLIAIGSEQLYYASSSQSIDISSFQAGLNIQQTNARKNLRKIGERLDQGNKAHKLYPKYAHNIAYYVYNKNGKLLYWSDNQITAPDNYSDLNHTSLIQLQNAYCIKQVRKHKEYTLVALIKIKDNYPYENDYLENNFPEELQMDKSIVPYIGSASDENAVFDLNNEYLFSLKSSETLIPNKYYSYLSMFAWTVCFVLLFMLAIRLAKAVFKTEKLHFRSYIFSVAIHSIIVSLFIFTERPQIFHTTDLFSPVFYASGAILSSLGNLIVLSLFLTVEILLFYRYVKIPKSLLQSKIASYLPFFFNFILFIFFLFYGGLLKNLIYNSSFSITLDNFDQNSVLPFASTSLIFIWLTSIYLLRLKGLQYLKIKNIYSLTINNIAAGMILAIVVLFIDADLFSFILWNLCISFVIDFTFLRKNSYSLSNLALINIVVALFLGSYISQQNENKNSSKYKAIAENVSSEGVLYRDLLAEILFEELNEDLYNDEALFELSNNSETTQAEVQAYLTNNYFRGFWSSYEVKTFLFDEEVNSQKDREKASQYEWISATSRKIKRSNFYYCNHENIKIDYLAIIDLHGEKLYIELYSKQRTVSFSYPEQLLHSGKKKDQMNPISIAKYSNDSLYSNLGDYRFPISFKSFEEKKEQFYSYYTGEHIHYIYKDQHANKIVISKKQANFYYSYIVFVAYLFAIFYITTLLILGIRALILKSVRSDFSFLSKLQLSFTLLLIFSFVVIFIVSVSYIIVQYKASQKNELQNKTNYIAKFIQSEYKDYDNLRTSNNVELNFFIQDLSKTYETDIHLYDRRGFLITSSQSIIFSKGLMSYRISPYPFFGRKKDFIITESIGKLSYLAAYNPIYNKNNKLIAYIAVPSFFSSTEIQKEIFDVLAVIINVYLLIILVSILLSFIINEQLSKPIKSIEEKLKHINLGGKNEKIHYKHKDEVGKLVDQYNLMVDKLEDSAQKLAQSERELAWKQMARQITHEINNPLTPMKLTIQQLQRMKDIDSEAFDEYFKKSSKMLIEQIENLSRIATAFSNFAKMPEAQRERIDITERLQSVVELFKNNKEGVSIEFESTLENAFVLADKEQLTQVFNNLIKNAIQAIPEQQNGEVKVKLSSYNRHVIIEIKDNGTGIPNEVQNKLFTPNFTTKNSGMGLGLAIVKNIVTLADGRIWFNTFEGMGTSFYVDFPQVD